MTWSVRISDKALKQLRKTDPGHRRIILAWLAKSIDGCADPRQFGKALSANFAGKWRYRIGEYRVIVEIRDDELIVLALEVGHRKNVY
ncbi:MAG: type II toxin-antitoxin system RelE/ParE family toxin [Coriobacteriia bacterium]|nr:type II toxin-antitoxin system RelE/ParE family toxin [Coriobacteriia bacterium]